MNIDAELEKIFAGRWIAGYYPEDALKKTEYINSKGISTMINFLGEDVMEKSKIKETLNTYYLLVKEIKKRGLHSAISLKPTEIGLKINYKTFLKNYIMLVKFAKRNGVFVWLDMELPEYVDSTIKAYGKAIKYGNAGICIQAYLKRSISDVSKLVKHGAKIRLVKGAYRLDSEGVLKSHREVSRNYLMISKIMLQKSNNMMFATHNNRIVDNILKMNKRYGKKVTFAMLNGIRSKYAKYLKAHKQKVSIYVPFGKDWVAFGYRRLIEQNHRKLVLRSLFEKQDL